MSELYSDTTPEYIVIDMTDPCYAIGALYKDIATLKAGLATERKEHIEDEAVYVACIAEKAALVEAAREYSYNEHFPDCKIHRPTIKVCTCGYAELSALLQSEGEI